MTETTIRLEFRTCPLCNKRYGNRPAVSRTDNETLICPDCGTRQSLEAVGISKDEIDEILQILHRYQRL